MWKATVGCNVSDVKLKNGGDDDWETDPDFINDVTEEEQRWGSKTVEGSGRTSAAIDIQELRENVTKDDADFKKKQLEGGLKSSFGYGGKFGVQSDRMDQSAVGHDYVAKVEKHASQVDSAKGFGGKFGVQADRQDKSAVGWDHHEKLHQHASQKDYATGFGGKYGIQKDRVDRNAVGWDHLEKTEKHESQKDYTKGFGGKFGVEKEKQDKSALGWDYQEKTEKHSSQKDYSKGFGGKFGVQQDRKDKSALGWEEVTKVEAHPSQTDMKKGFGGKFGIERDRQDKSAHSFSEVQKPQSSYQKERSQSVGSEKASSLRARFENLARTNEEEVRKKADEERVRRLARDEKEKDQAKKDETERQRSLSLRQTEPIADKKVQENDKSNRVAETEHSTGRISSMVGVPTPLLQAAEPLRPKQLDQKKGILHRFEAVEEQKSPEEKNKEISSWINESESCKPPDGYTAPSVEPSNEELYDVPEERGFTAVAVYDYQAADVDEISFDPDDVITNIEMIDDGWWRGECNGQVGLFPSNYVELWE